MKGKFDYDIAIIGLGPAGSTLARLLSPKYKVIAIDKKVFGDDGFQKPCGGLISGDAQKALASFDLTLPKDVLVDPQIFAVKTIDLKNRLIRHYQRFYINLDRHKFDLWLESIIPERVEVHSNAICTELKRKNGGFVVSYLEKEEVRTFSARFLVGADGANSIVRRTFYPDKKIRNYLSIQQWFPETHPNPFYSCIFDPETTDCCSWSISKDHQFIFGGAFPMDNAKQRFERQKEKLEKIGFRFGEPLKTEACLVLRPSSFRDFCKGENGIFFIGEAAGFISPSSLEGISSAIYSARDLSRVLNHPHGDLNRRYWNKTLKIRIKIGLKLLKCPFMYNSFLRKLVLKSGLQSIKIDGTTNTGKNPAFSAKK
ncbi:MAG: FAD-binding protein [Anaerotignum sp.]|nr:FAD-binding protein [Anaerotignum sp.]